MRNPSTGCVWGGGNLPAWGGKKGGQVVRDSPVQVWSLAVRALRISWWPSPRHTLSLHMAGDRMQQQSSRDNKTQCPCYSVTTPVGLTRC